MAFRQIAECDFCHKQVDAKVVPLLFNGISDGLSEVPEQWLRLTVNDKTFLFCANECASKFFAKYSTEEKKENVR